jgi:hypothetical protein|tara:strand:- start:367 stop:702 length:336 start_codon:yes stop_codon:yes gene_type:complete
MPTTYQNAIKTLDSTSITDVYECPQGATAILKTVSAYNTNASNAASLILHIFDNSASGTTEFEKTAAIAAETRKGYLTGGEVIVLESKDKLRMTAGTADYFDIFVSLLEIT